MDEDVISAVVNELTKNEEDLALESVQVFDAFKLPRLAFDISLRQYKLCVLGSMARAGVRPVRWDRSRGSHACPPLPSELASSLSLQADAAAKITLYRQRCESATLPALFSAGIPAPTGSPAR